MYIATKRHKQVTLPKEYKCQKHKKGESKTVSETIPLYLQVLKNHYPTNETTVYTFMLANMRHSYFVHHERV